MNEEELKALFPESYGDAEEVAMSSFNIKELR